MSPPYMICWSTLAYGLENGVQGRTQSWVMLMNQSLSLLYALSLESTTAVRQTLAPL